MKTYFSENLKVLMKKKDLSVSALSDISKIPQTTIRSYLSGKVYPSIKNAAEIAKCLETDLDEMVLKSQF